jgi:general secretion pathway protein H
VNNPILQYSSLNIRQRGFTLLEIMVVVLLIGISIAVIALNLERDIDQVAEQEARRFAALVEHLRDESILTGRLYGVEIDEPESRYRFLIFDKKWLPVEQDDSFRPRVIPDYLTIQFNAGQDQDGNTLVVVDALGEIQPFFLTIIGRDFEYVVNLNANQNVEVERKPHEAG